MSAARNNYCYFCRDRAKEKSMIEHQRSHQEEILQTRQSNDMKDVVVTKCQICEEPVNLTRMRSHTRTRHKMKITEYKEMYGQQYYDPIELVLHKCGLCMEYLLLDSDVIAQHLRSNTRTHGNITHANYNKTYMKLRSSVKLEKLEFSDSSATELMAEVSEDESVREFREYLKTLSSDLHFPALESLLTLQNFSPENVIEFCSDLSSKYV